MTASCGLKARMEKIKIKYNKLFVKRGGVGGRTIVVVANGTDGHRAIALRDGHNISELRTLRKRNIFILKINSNAPSGKQAKMERKERRATSELLLASCAMLARNEKVKENEFVIEKSGEGRQRRPGHVQQRHRPRACPHSTDDSAFTFLFYRSIFRPGCSMSTTTFVRNAVNARP